MLRTCGSLDYMQNKQKAFIGPVGNAVAVLTVVCGELMLD